MICADIWASDKCCCFSCHKDCKDPIKEMDKFKSKIRNMWGKDEMRNAMHSTDNIKDIERETNIAFRKR